MNLKCLICSDLLTAYAEIFVTKCGHLFHYHCLIQWINRSQTCPQCRTKSTEKTIYKVFLSVEENVETTDMAVLHNKLDNLQLQISMKDRDVKNAREMCETVKKQNLGLREENKEQENKIRILESAMCALKEQVTYFKTKSKEGKRLETELIDIRKKMCEIKNVELILSGTQEEVNEMLRNTQDPYSLSLLVITLKKELIEADKSKKQYQTSYKTALAKSQFYRQKILNLKETSEKLLETAESHKHCETERQYLKDKIVELQNKHKFSLGTATSINRLVTESPMPISKVTANENSPSITETVQALANSDSPYLRVQTSSIGLSGLLTYNDKLSTGSNKNSSIFQKPSLRIETLKRPLAATYDGLGGHSKDEDFPSPRSSLTPKKLKPSISATARKFKKLGSQQKLSFQKSN